MDRQQLTEQIAALNLILGKISRYQKQNQYVYLRPFESWRTGYNQIAERLMTAEVLSVPLFKLKERDYSPSGKSIRLETVEKLVKTIHQQVFRLEEKIEERNRAAENKLAVPHPFEKFFPLDDAGEPVAPAFRADRILVAIPGDEGGGNLLRQGIQPVLDRLGLSAFFVDGPLPDEAAFAELCRELYACQLVLAHPADGSPHIMLVLGLAYGIGKPVVLLHPEQEPLPGGLHSDECLSYVKVSDIDALLSSLFA